MSELGTLILARAQGRDLLLEAAQILEVLPAAPVTALPGPVPGIAGVLLYHGEFLPVLDWNGLPGYPGGMIWASALAILKRRLALPLEDIAGVHEPGGEGRVIESAEGDPWEHVLACRCALGGVSMPLLDADKLIGWLHHQRAKR
jgi:hypothetical protein